MKAKLSTALAAACALALGVGAAKADMTTQNITWPSPVPPNAGFFVQSNGFQLFNPSSGNLTQVTVTGLGNVSDPGSSSVTILNPNDNTLAASSSSSSPFHFDFTQSYGPGDLNFNQFINTSGFGNAFGVV